MMGCSKPVVFESVGIDGKKMIGFLDNSEREVGQSELDDLWQGGADGEEAARDRDNS